MSIFFFLSKKLVFREPTGSFKTLNTGSKFKCEEMRKNGQKALGTAEHQNID
jgi:hypothetical protein